MLSKEVREQEYAKLLPLSLSFAGFFTTDYEAARDLAADAVEYVMRHEGRFDPERGFKFVTFAAAYMTLFMQSEARKASRRAALSEREAEDVFDRGLPDVSSVNSDAAELAEQRDAVDYFRKILFPILSPAAQRVFEAILTADSAHAKDLVKPAQVASVDSVDVYKTAIRKAAKSKEDEILKDLGVRCKNR